MAGAAGAGAAARRELRAAARVEPLFDGAGGMAAAHDGRRVLVGVTDAAHVLDVASGASLCRLAGDGEQLTALALGPDASAAFLASRSFQVAHYAVPAPQGPDDNDIGTAARTRDGTLVRRFKAHAGPVMGMAVSGLRSLPLPPSPPSADPTRPSSPADLTAVLPLPGRWQVDPTGALLATGAADQAVKVWDTEHGYATHVLRGHGAMVVSVAFHPDPAALRLVSSADDGRVRVWDLERKACVAELDGHASAVPRVAFAAGGALLLTAGRDKVVNVWDLAAGGARCATVPVHEPVEGLAAVGLERDEAAAAAEGRPAKRKRRGRAGLRGSFVTVGHKGAARAWDAATGKCTAELQLCRGAAFGEACTDLALHGPSGRALCAISDGQLLELQVGGGEGGGEGGEEGAPPALACTRQMLGNLEQVTDVAFVDRAGTLLAVSTNSSDVYVLRKPEPAEPGVEVTVAAEEGDGPDGRGSPPPPPAATATVTSTPRSVATCKGHTDIVLCLAAVGAGEGCLLASGSKDRAVRLWRPLPGGRCLGVGGGHFTAVGAVCFVGPPGAGPCLLASGDADGFVKTWEAPAGLREGGGGGGAEADGPPAEMRMGVTIAAHAKEVNSVAASPDGRFLCTTAQDRTAKVWRLPQLAPVRTLRGHRRGVWGAAFSPIEQILCTCSGDRTVKLWSLGEGTCLRTLEGHTASVLRAAFCSLGTQLVTTGADGLVKLWSVRTGECVNTFALHEDKVWALTLGAGDGAFAATGGSDGQLTFWTDVTAELRAEEQAAEAAQLERGLEVERALSQRDFSRAFHLALRLSHPRKLLAVLDRLLLEGDLAAAVASLRPCLRRLGEDEVGQVLAFCAQWGVHANVLAANLLLRAVLEARGGDLGRRARKSLEAIELYGKRHFARLERLRASTYILDLTLGGGAR